MVLHSDTTEQIIDTEGRTEVPRTDGTVQCKGAENAGHVMTRVLQAL